MSNLTTHAETELRRAGFYDADSDYGGMVPGAVMELMTTFANQGHSGSSAHLVVSLFSKLALFELLGPLTNNPEEWQKIDLGNSWESRRKPSCFSDDGGKTYYDLDEHPWYQKLYLKLPFRVKRIHRWIMTHPRHKSRSWTSV